LKPARPGLL